MFSLYCRNQCCSSESNSFFLVNDKLNLYYSIWLNTECVGIHLQMSKPVSVRKHECFLPPSLFPFFLSIPSMCSLFATIHLGGTNTWSPPSAWGLALWSDSVELYNSQGGEWPFTQTISHFSLAAESAKRKNDAICSCASQPRLFLSGHRHKQKLCELINHSDAFRLTLQ